MKRYHAQKESLPSRERGLKLTEKSRLTDIRSVAPLAGARIEISVFMVCTPLSVVAPLAGARIEIMSHVTVLKRWLKSLPSRERGLKSVEDIVHRDTESVAPLAGARIEIAEFTANTFCFRRRSPRGSED